MRLNAFFSMGLVCVLTLLMPLPAQADEGSAPQCAEAESNGGWGRIERPMRFMRVSYEGAEWVLAEGRIAGDTASAFEAFLAEMDEAPMGVLLNSAGGELRPALAMGRSIRAYNLATRVAGRDCAESAPEPSITSNEAECASSCAYAFLGGVSRDARPGSLGFHRIFTAESHAAIAAADLDDAYQEMLRELLLYILEMGASPELLGLAQVTPISMLYRPEAPELTALSIATAPVDQPLSTQLAANF